MRSARSSSNRPKSGDFSDSAYMSRMSQERPQSQPHSRTHQPKRTSVPTSKHVVQTDAIELETLSRWVGFRSPGVISPLMCRRSLNGPLTSTSDGATTKRLVTDDSASSAEIKSVLQDADPPLS